ncbi:MAG: hypothetical protein EZS28_013424 [Streblomastix strix]|uniref:Uncharacterized protein n=1 Tax=Streblomastix strix TaxID=222440 RepID=A0A5J4W882_9EUKA|nr:MAG: hypothetical protein EZS28_013424 [Streblomastix strix]
MTILARIVEDWSFNLKVQRHIKIISLAISDAARFSYMNILVPRGHHDIEKGKEKKKMIGEKRDDYFVIERANKIDKGDSIRKK